MIEGALVLPPTTCGMIEASITRRPRMPCTRSRGSTTASAPMPHAAGADGMEVGDAAVAQILDQSLVARHGRSRLHLLADVGLERRLLGDLPRQPHAVEHRVDVVGGLEELELDLRRAQRIGALEADPAAPLGPQVHRRDREARPLVGIDAVAVAAFDRPQEDVHLQVGPVEAGVRAHQDAGERADAGERPAAAERILDAGERSCGWARGRDR